MPTYILREMLHLPISPEEMPSYGYGDYAKTEIVNVAEVEADSERKAQNKFKRMFPERRLRFSKNSPVCTVWIMTREELEATSN